MNALAESGWLGLLPPSELRVWLVLYRHAGTDGTARVSHGTIGKCAGLRREHAARAARSLERRGLVRVLVRGRTVGRKGERTANHYALLGTVPRIGNSAASGTNDGLE